MIDSPSEWIITKKGDLVQIKDSEILTDKKLETIRQKLSSSGRFKGKTPEQIAKERYDKVWEENNFDIEKIHDWLYDEKNKDRVEIVKLEGQELKEAIEAIFKHVKGSRQKWRIKKETLVNEETGQVIYFNSQINEVITDLRTNWDYRYNGGSVIIREPREHKPKEKHTSTLIFLHGTYGAINQFPELEKNFPNTKFIYPNSPILQYDMWHGSRPAPGEQCQGWINITGDAHELMDTDVCPNNPPPKKNFEEADKIIHLDYHQLMRAVSYINEIIEREIEVGISPEKIFISGYSQGGLLTLATYLTSPHKLGGFISLCRLLPRWDKLLVKPSTKNKEVPCLIINNSKDPWVPFWTGQKSYDLLKERGYNVEFKTHPGLEHAWKNEDVISFLEKCFSQKNRKNTGGEENRWGTAQKVTMAGGAIVIIFVIFLIIFRRKKEKP